VERYGDHGIAFAIEIERPSLEGEPRHADLWEALIG